MADNVTLPTTGTGTATPVVETYDIGAGVQRQAVAEGRKTPAAGTISQVTTGGTAVTVISGPCNGGIITNPANGTRQAVTAEPLYVDMVGTPLATEAGAVGTTFALDPGQSFDIPALASGVAVKVNALTGGHKFSVMKW